MLDGPIADRCGRDPRTGRYESGNAGGPGNPHAAQVSRLRAAMLAAVTPQDVTELVGTLLALAKAGNVAAIREVLDRVLGRSESIDLLVRVEALEHRGEHRGIVPTLTRGTSEGGSTWTSADESNDSNG